MATVSSESNSVVSVDVDNLKEIDDNVYKDLQSGLDTTISLSETSDVLPKIDTDSTEIENDNKFKSILFNKDVNVNNETELNDSLECITAFSKDKEYDNLTEILNKDMLTDNSNDISSLSQVLYNERHSNIKNSKTIEVNTKNIPEISNNIYTGPADLKKNLTSSTASLNEVPQVTISLTKSKLSRSAENLSSNLATVDTKVPTNIDANKILSEFTNQKTKVQAIQKVPEVGTDSRYSRMPKEILNQDIGSIVKNVHGIFSSVSGSLKNAYINSQRGSVPKSTTIKTPSSKIMNEIFEEESMLEVNSEKEVNVDNHVEGDLKQEGGKLEPLEKLLAEQKNEMATLKDRVRQQTVELAEKERLFKDMENKVDLMRKRVEQAEREKNTAVMRYASSECTIIEAKRAAENAAKNEKNAITEVELMSGKLKSAHAEKQRICQLYDDKCHELLNTERELNKLREDMKELEGRLKWTQSKLRMEMDAYKEGAERIEKLQQQVNELESAKEDTALRQAESTKSKQLESELKESQASLILIRHEREELEKKVTSLQQQCDTWKRERDEAIGSLALLNEEVEKLRESNLRLEEEAAALAALQAKAALADTLAVQLEREQIKIKEMEHALSKATALADTCSQREASALKHAAQLVSQHLDRTNTLEKEADKVTALSADNAALRSQLSTLESQVTLLQASLSEETDRRNRENRTMARKIAELTEELGEVNKKLEWEKGENGVLKKKHASSIKELNRELQRFMKRCEILESKIPHENGDSNRTGSVSSLSSSDSPSDEKQNGHPEIVPEIQVRSPDRQALIERIVSLQRTNARRSERCEFLEEHCSQLTEELRKKSKLLRQVLCSTPGHALSGDSSDQNKKEIARLGGSMAAVWGGDPNGMTLELSLEMNTRLQALLEDTLLKNITLKENMDTLGKEIARLKQPNKVNK